ncbi:MAG: hypothetical protein CMQ19_03140 [Gammaproteobacteria bacterium]|nr:hypothetical protein [Gammaproteobacteria bacterium]
MARYRHRWTLLKLATWNCHHAHIMMTNPTRTTRIPAAIDMSEASRIIGINECAAPAHPTSSIAIRGGLYCTNRGGVLIEVVALSKVITVSLELLYEM